MEARLLLSFFLSAHLSPPLWDLILWCLSLLCHPSPLSCHFHLQTVTVHGLGPVKPLSRLSVSSHSFPSISLISSAQFNLILCTVIRHFHHLIFEITQHFSLVFLTLSMFPSQLHIWLFPLTPLSLSLLFSVGQWHWKVLPCILKDGTAWELSVNAAWGTGLVHALPHEGFFGAWWTLQMMQGWADSHEVEKLWSCSLNVLDILVKLVTQNPVDWALVNMLHM